MMQAPRVSIVIPTFNAATYLPETLRSLRDQMSDLELVIVDDGSTDDTAAVVEPFLSESVRYKRIENSGGPARPRNIGIQMSRAPLVAFFDADDLALPRTLETSVRLMEAYREVGMLCTNFHIGSAHLEITKPRVIDEKVGLNQAEKELLADGVWRIPSNAALTALLQNNFVGTPSVIIRREVFERIGGYDESLRNLDDRDMWLRVARHYDLIYRDEPTFIYRNVPTSISKKGLERQALERIFVGTKLVSMGLPLTQRRLARQWIGQNYLAIGYIRTRYVSAEGAWNAFARSFVIAPSWASFKGIVKAILPMPIQRILSRMRE